MYITEVVIIFLGMFVCSHMKATVATLYICDGEGCLFKGNYAGVLCTWSAWPGLASGGTLSFNYSASEL